MGAETGSTASAGHWSGHAERWQDLGAPLKPLREDMDAVIAAYGDLAPRADGFDALLLGVTPQLATLPWPAHTRLTAVDHAFGMVSRVWPGGPAGGRGGAIVADWRALPLGDRSIDFVAGDGSYNSVESIAAQRAVSAEVVRVLRAGGSFALRVYVRPEEQTSPAEVVDQLRRGAFASFSAFKMRLLMAMPPSADGSIRLGDAWERWAEGAIDPAALAAARGWPAAAVATIDAYRGSDARYVFLSLAETREVLAPHFTEVRAVTKRYELGALCPTLVLKPR